MDVHVVRRGERLGKLPTSERPNKQKGTPPSRCFAARLTGFNPSSLSSRRRAVVPRARSARPSCHHTHALSMRGCPVSTCLLPSSDFSRAHFRALSLSPSLCFSIFRSIPFRTRARPGSVLDERGNCDVEVGASDLPLVGRWFGVSSLLWFLSHSLSIPRAFSPASPRWTFDNET